MREKRREEPKWRRGGRGQSGWREGRAKAVRGAAALTVAARGTNAAAHPPLFQTTNVA